ncbi:MAG: cytidylate kinase-like family protein [Chloroflexi bacterium]|nr:cytidylate kinase-like family protein [Chloroflexota bacterium]
MDQQAIATMRAVTMSREYGSGGGEIAARLAHRLDWHLIDHQIVARAARESGVHEAVMRAFDEKTEDVFSRIMKWPYPVTAEEKQAYRQALDRVVLEAANTGHVVIVGRGSQVLLADRRDVLHVRVVAPLEQCIEYVVRREGLGTEAARKRVQEKDRARARYLQTEFHRQYDDPHLYDLVINTAVLDLDSAVDVICQMLERKASRLNVPVEELGPAAGLPRYPGQAADFPAQGASSSEGK